jgi:DNA-binding MarR family transcriptional regulator
MLDVQNTIPYIAHRVAWKYRVILNRIIRQAGHRITPEEFIVLDYLAYHGPASQKELSTATYKGKANVTRLMRRLLEEQYVVRERAVDDRRFYKISLTKKGRHTVKTLVPLFLEFTDMVKRHYGGDKLAVLRESLSDFSNCLDSAYLEFDETQKHNTQS